MKTKTKMASMLLMLSTALTALAQQDNPPCVVVVDNDGHETSWPVGQVEKLLFSEEGIGVLPINGELAKYPYYEVDRVKLWAEPSSVREMTVGNAMAVWPSPAISYINVAGVQKGDEIRLISRDGAIAVSVEATEGINLIDVSRLPSGTYIVAAADKRVKIIKK